ncbi:Prefoldin subunit 3 [Oopsacas minuta]|uniref:Prefoldin subunit 3 n=1 Tax=Oopsacas minuta TaxID=111878 RepID=A0AAV7JAR8_9METZ|nr:Prefoldin subunit 3 [Oopsacas minuta]
MAALEASVSEISKPHGGIPEAHFLEDVDTFMKKPENSSAEGVIKRLDEQHQKYKFWEVNLLQRKKRLRLQMPDIISTLEMVQFLKTQKSSSTPLSTQFLLNENVYASAEITPTQTAYLWLGANVMLEYTIDDAEKLLSKNLEAAQEGLKTTSNDLDFLRDQYTTTEVNMARVYNWDVQRRKKEGKS